MQTAAENFHIHLEYVAGALLHFKFALSYQIFFFVTTAYESLRWLIT